MTAQGPVDQERMRIAAIPEISGLVWQPFAVWARVPASPSGTEMPVYKQPSRQIHSNPPQCGRRRKTTGRVFDPAAGLSGFFSCGKHN